MDVGGWGAASGISPVDACRLWVHACPPRVHPPPTALSTAASKHTQEGPIYIFVATVPVFLDSLFKFWIFTQLNKIDPAAAVTLKKMDTH